MTNCTVACYCVNVLELSTFRNYNCGLLSFECYRLFTTDTYVIRFWDRFSWHIEIMQICWLLHKLSMQIIRSVSYTSKYFFFEIFRNFSPAYKLIQILATFLWHIPWNGIVIVAAKLIVNNYLSCIQTISRGKIS